MPRYGLLPGLLAVAACSGPSRNANTGVTLAPSVAGEVDAAPATATPPPAAAADPSLAFRQQYANPGGMWTPLQMALPRHVETFHRLGVAIDPAQLADPLAPPLSAVVSLSGCTASFVSPDGLLATNHHCVQGALQFNSTPAENLVERGFLARTRAEERAAGPARRVLVAQAFKDVTREMRDGLETIADPGARKADSERRQKRLVAACEKDRPGIRCQLSSFFGGGQYTQIENLELRDVRLVYAPERAVGNYGGEVDNWAWPRHTGDFSFYRAYVGKDGKPADFSPDNVPFHPRHFLKVSTAGLKAHDFVMIAGYPGTTRRTETALETRHNIDWFYPYTIAYSQARYAVFESHLKDGGETGIKATVAKQSVQNGIEKYAGTLKRLTSSDLLQRKVALDQQIKQWAAEPGRERHRAAITRLEQSLAEEQQRARADFDREAAFGGSRLLATAISLTRWAEERAKADPDRKPGYQERDLPRAIAAQKQFAKGHDRVLDRAIFQLALRRALALPEADRPWLAPLLEAKKGATIDEALIDRTLEAWYANPPIEEEKLRLELLSRATSARMAAEKDPFLRAAQRIWSTYKAEEKRSDARVGERLLFTPSYVEAMREVVGGLLSPDANSTLRITYGTVRSFKPGSSAAVDRPFTTAAEIPAKNSGKAPFDAPPALLAAIQGKRYGRYADPALGGELPVDFLSDLDITGGNSGSPVINLRGELVGLAFDGTIDGVASDVVFDGASTRVIQVDARYLLWYMDSIAGADHLITEMGIDPQR